MHIFQRIGYYLGGFSAGLVLLFFIFNGKRTQCNYGPQARVLNDLGKKEWRTNVNLPTFLKLDSLGVQKILSLSQVDFSASDTKRDSCKLYALNSQYNENKYQLFVENCKGSVFIQSFTEIP